MTSQTDNLFAPFIPDEFIKIDSTHGHIGRFYWSNQIQMTIEQSGPNFYESITNELPGNCALISNIGDWWAWVWS
jgi:hypothetical protein